MKAALEMLKFNDDLFYKRIASLSKEEVHAQMNDELAPIIWNAGHLLNVRLGLLKQFGEQEGYDWQPLFREKYDPAKTYPTVMEIWEAWKKCSQELFQKIEAATEEELTREIKVNLPHSDSTIRGHIIFVLYHECWHYGQIAYMRRFQGMEGLVPY